MDALDGILKPPILALLWLLFASPFIVVSAIVARAMKRRRVCSPWAVGGFSLAVAIAVAPIPTPIITVFVPNGFALVRGDYVALLFNSDRFYGHLWPWVAKSLLVTWLIAGFLAWRYIAQSGKRMTEGKNDV